MTRLYRLYRRWMEGWEDRLCFRTNNRVWRPFDWGIEWAINWPVSLDNPRNGHTPEDYLRLLNHRVIEDSDRFFDYVPPSDFRLDGDILRFSSAVQTPYPENN